MMPTEAQRAYGARHKMSSEILSDLISSGRLTPDGKLIHASRREPLRIPTQEEIANHNPAGPPPGPRFKANRHNGDTGDSRPFTTPRLVNLATVKPQAVEWLWPRRFPLGKISMIVGEPGLGKSQLTTDMTATVTTGGLWPDGTFNNSGQPGSVVLLSAEDDLSDTVVPRLIAAGAELDKVTAIQGVEFRLDDDSPAKERCFNLESDLPALEQAMAAQPGCRLVVIDPISSYLGKTDSHKNAELRVLLAPLAELAAKHMVAVVCVSHLNKTSGAKAMHRVTGSLAFVAAARAAWLVAADKSDPKRRLMVQIKANLAPDPGGLAFGIVDVDGAPALAWERGVIVTTTADEALSDDVPRRNQNREAAKVWLEKLLTDGAMAQAAIKEKADQDGFAWRTIRRAAEDLGVESFKSDFKGGWSWRLQPTEPAADGSEPPSPSEVDTFDESPF